MQNDPIALPPAPLPPPLKKKENERLPKKRRLKEDW